MTIQGLTVCVAVLIGNEFAMKIPGEIPKYDLSSRTQFLFIKITYLLWYVYITVVLIVFYGGFRGDVINDRHNAVLMVLFSVISCGGLK